ncbi:MAG: molybdenum cofactor biosynthesis protein A [Methanosaeta sp. PtaU1.Bin060]|nr:MAG: molybdenum cofactor biosynthesis protein A [Methanosaeta sp. PtaU1.Bin060]
MHPTNFEKTAFSLCPICLKVVPARIFNDGDDVFMEKRCEEDGDFRELLWHDVSLYKRFYSYLSDGQGLKDPLAERTGCPYDCGICSHHKTSTLLGNIDVTNRCNMACPVCFADAGGRVYEPSIDQIKAMMQNLRSEEPVPCPAVQFSGGEPTIRDDLPQIIALAKAMGFAQVQVATNGLRLAESIDLCRDLMDRGLSTVYLQFDGVTPEPYLINRGRDLLPVKLRALENFRTVGLRSAVLVPTLARGVNDQQVGGIVRFAAKNMDVIRGVNFQPVSFVGRIDALERAKRRVTIPDLFALLEEQMDNEITREDFYPVPFVVPISQIIAAQTEEARPTFTIHPCCGAATYVYKLDDHLIPITRFIDVEGLLETIKREVENYDGSSLGKIRMNGVILKDLHKFVDETKVPRDLNIARLLLGVLRSGTHESLADFHAKTLFLGAMHFQDPYNIELDRLQRCGIHYATPDGRIIPFCAYNTLHRQAVEKKFSVPRTDATKQ